MAANPHGKPNDGPSFGERYRELTRLSFPPRYPLAQFPNTPLWLAIVASLAERVLNGTAAGIAAALGTVGIVVWAWLELFDGVNLFRRLLGLAVLVSTVVGLGTQVA